MMTYVYDDAVKTTSNGKFRAYRQSAWWIGDFETFADAKRALQIANSAGASKSQRGYYVGMYLTDAEHTAQVMERPICKMFGYEQPVSVDDVRRTILSGEKCSLIGGLIPVAA